MKNPLLIRLIFIGVIILAFLLTTAIGNRYHPWDAFLEESGVGILQFENLADTDVSGSDSGEFSDRVDQVLHNVYLLLFSDSSNGAVNRYAKNLLSPVEDTAKSVSMAAAYSGIFQSSFSDPVFASLAIILFFLIYYFVQFATNKLLDRLHDLKWMQDAAWLENQVIGYCASGISAFLFLLLSYWILYGLNILQEKGGFGFIYSALNSDNALVVLPILLLMIALMAGFVLMLIALVICLSPYYIMMALPVALAAVFPVWVPMTARLFVCFVLEMVIFGTVVPWLSERLNLWNTVKKLLEIVGWIFHVFLAIPRFLLWPVRKLFGID